MPGNHSTKKVPTLVKVIAIFNYFTAAFLILGAIIGVAVAGLALNMWGLDGIEPAIVLGIIMILFAIFMIFLGRDLWRGRNWARITEIVLAIAWLLIALLGILQQNYWDFVGLIANGVIAGYLLFNTRVKAAFTPRR